MAAYKEGHYDSSLAPWWFATVLVINAAPLHVSQWDMGQANSQSTRQTNFSQKWFLSF